MLAAHFNIQKLLTGLLLGANTATEAGADDTSATEALLVVQGSMHGLHHKLAAQLLVPGITEQCGFATLLIQSVQLATTQKSLCVQTVHTQAWHRSCQC
jgi:hypothetical protein